MPGGIGTLSQLMQLMSSCPHMCGCALLDTGSMVSTITETCFWRYFEPWGQDRLRQYQWLQLRAANGLAIPYLGYLELDVVLCNKDIPGCGVRSLLLKYTHLKDY